MVSHRGLTVYAVGNDHLAELLLNLTKESKVTAPDIALYRKDVYANGGEGNYEALMAILNRHMLMHRETVNNQQLRGALNKYANPHGRPAAPVGTLKSGKGSAPASTPCRYYTADGGCRNGDGCPYLHGSGLPAASAGTDGGKGWKEKEERQGERKRQR